MTSIRKKRFDQKTRDGSTKSLEDSARHGKTDRFSRALGKNAGDWSKHLDMWK